MLSKQDFTYLKQELLVIEARLNKNLNKPLFLKVEGWALIRGVGAYSRGGRLFEGWALIRGVGAYSRGDLLNNFVSRVITYSRGALICGGPLLETCKLLAVL